MTRRLLLIIGLLACFGSYSTLTIYADDGIPDNCESTGAAYYRPNIFARFELHNRRLVLVNWATGEIVQTVASDVGEGQILGWSVDCRYLAVGLGNTASMDTVVYDTLDNVRIGSVPDARGQAHHITWGVGNYLVVETRNGAILWNVPANTQQILTTSFDPYTARNFSRLRWDAANMILIVNLAVGGRVAYDLHTGLETTVEPVVDYVAPEAEVETQIVGGAEYPCAQYVPSGYREWYSTRGSQLPRLGLVYDIPSRTIALYLIDQGQPYESLAVLEGTVNASWMQARGWSLNCRFVAASLGVPGQDASDTYVWDISTGQRVGVYPDARDVVHPITWGADTLVIETRDGAFLWNLVTNTRTLIQPFVRTESGTYSERIQSFHSVRFSSDGSLLYTVNVDTPDTVSAYDGYTGAALGQYRMEGAAQPVTFTASLNGRTLVLDSHTNGVLGIVDRTTGVVLPLTREERGRASRAFISPDGRFVAFVSGQGDVLVWDVNNLSHQPNAVYTLPPEYRSSVQFLRFSDDVTLAYTGSSYRQFTLNVTTGEFHGDRNPPPGVSAVAGTSGYSPLYGYWYSPQDTPICENDSYPAYDADTNQIVLRSESIVRVVVENVSDIAGVRASPGCRYILAYSLPVTREAAPYDNAPVDDASYDHFSDELVFYDALTGAELLRLAHPYRYYANAQVAWSLDSLWAMIRVSTGSYIWDVAQNRLMPIEVRPENWYGDIDAIVYWDFARGQMLISSNHGAVAFDLRTGEQRTLYSCDIFGDGWCSAYYFLMNFSIRDERTLFVAWEYGGKVAAHDLDTGVSHQFYTGNASLHLGNRIALSPDGSLIATARGVIRIWREWTERPPAGTSRRPLYQFTGPSTLITSIRFVDDHTVETVSADGVQRWDITTGTLVP